MDRAAIQQFVQRAFLVYVNALSVISRSATTPWSRNQSSAHVVNAVTVSARSSSCSSL
jgi:hypothetical protein